MRSNLTRLVVLGATALVLAACGGNEDEGKIRDVVEELEAASRDGNGERICSELFTENLAISIQRAARQPCSDEVAENVASESAKFTLAALKVTGDKATAQLVDGEERRSDVLFERAGESWRIARIAGVGS